MPTMFERSGLTGRRRVVAGVALLALVVVTATVGLRRSPKEDAARTSPAPASQGVDVARAPEKPSMTDDAKPAAEVPSETATDRPLPEKPEKTELASSTPPPDTTPKPEPQAQVVPQVENKPVPESKPAPDAVSEAKPDPKPAETTRPTTGLFVDLRDRQPEVAAPRPQVAIEPAAPNTASPAPSGSGTAKFRDERPLEKPSMPDGASAAAPALPSTKPTFADARAVQETAASTNTVAVPKFSETRALTQPALPARTMETANAPSPTVPRPSFQDQRRPDAPNAVDAKPADGVRFTDRRPVPSTSMFQDQRIAMEKTQAADVRAPEPTVPERRVARAPEVEIARPQASEAGRPTLVTIAPQNAATIDPRSCTEPIVVSEPLPAGQMRIRVTARCKASEPVQIRYGGAEFVRQLDGFGTLDFVLDCFTGDQTPAEIRFANGSRKSVPITARDLDRVSKIAVTWRAPVNLDLHVFEYGARIGTRGHVWAKLASSLQVASETSAKSGRGSGYLSVVDSDDSLGDKLEVYTFLHNDDQVAGTIGLALDYETRGANPSGATCGDGELAEVEFRLTILPRGGGPARQLGTLSRAECGKPLTDAARFASTALPGLRIRR